MDMSLEEIMSVMLSRIEGLSASMEDLRFRMNVLGSVMVDKGNVTKDDIRAAVRKQLNIMKYLGSAEEVDLGAVEGLSESIMNWFNGDMSAIKAELEEYKKMMEEAERKMKTEGQKIEIAGAGALGDLTGRNIKN
jgi:fructose/tagatose bisphosphate aldolase